MKEHKKIEDNALTAGESQTAYSRVSREPYVSRALMDKLMNLSYEAKLYIIYRLSKSMLKEDKATQEQEIQDITGNSI